MSILEAFFLASVFWKFSSNGNWNQTTPNCVGIGSPLCPSTTYTWHHMCMISLHNFSFAARERHGCMSPGHTIALSAGHSRQHGKNKHDQFGVFMSFNACWKFRVMSYSGIGYSRLSCGSKDLSKIGNAQVILLEYNSW